VDLLRDLVARGGPGWCLEPASSGTSTAGEDLLIFDLATTSSAVAIALDDGAALRIAACDRASEGARARARELRADELIEWKDLARADVRELLAAAARARTARCAASGV